MASLSDFMPHVLPYVVGCTYPLAELHIRNICIDFCTHAPIAQATLDPLDVIAGQIEYDIDTPSQTDATLILAANYRGRELAIVKTGDRNFLASREQPGEPSALMQAPGNVFQLDLMPSFDAIGAITMQIATKPTRTAMNVDDVLLEYAYEIGQGVVGRLLLMPGHEFSNPAIAMAYTSTYNLARTDARIRADRSFGAAPTRVRPRSFG